MSHGPAKIATPPHPPPPSPAPLPSLSRLVGRLAVPFRGRWAFLSFFYLLFVSFLRSVGVRRAKKALENDRPDIAIPGSREPIINVKQKRGRLGDFKGNISRNLTLKKKR
jgi:hypothetical protein